MRPTRFDTFDARTDSSHGPQDVIEADDQLAIKTPSNGLDSIRLNIVRAEAARITTPVCICLGERDVSPNPHVGPNYYSASKDVALHILPRSAHCQTFASTRHQMWRRMHEWVRLLVGPTSLKRTTKPMRVYGRVPGPARTSALLIELGWCRWRESNPHSVARIGF